MDVVFDGDRLQAGNEARERFYDSRGYGRPHNGGIELAPVEAAHLLFRGDLETVVDRRQDTTENDLDFHAFLASSAVSEVDFFVYKELRDRGFYLTPSELYDETGTEATAAETAADFAVYPRGDGPWDNTVAYRVLTVSEREDVTASTLRALAGATGETAGVLAVVDEESEVTYLELGEPAVSGSTDHDIPAFYGELLSDRVLVWEPPAALHDRAFYGQRLDRDDEPVQLSLVEAASLVKQDLLTLNCGQQSPESGHQSSDSGAEVTTRGREVEGERFDRRLTVYSALRAAGVVPKTGFKFGADFRTYADVTDIENLGHSELLVRVRPPSHDFSPRNLALDVRLAHGVRKRMVYALTDADGIDWLSVERLTP